MVCKSNCGFRKLTYYVCVMCCMLYCFSDFSRVFLTVQIVCVLRSCLIFWLGGGIPDHLFLYTVSSCPLFVVCHNWCTVGNPEILNLNIANCLLGSINICSYSFFLLFSCCCCYACVILSVSIVQYFGILLNLNSWYMVVDDLVKYHVLFYMPDCLYCWVLCCFSSMVSFHLIFNKLSHMTYIFDLCVCVLILFSSVYIICLFSCCKAENFLSNTCILSLWFECSAIVSCIAMLF